jgi:hypothetical protein
MIEESSAFVRACVCNNIQKTFAHALHACPLPIFGLVVLRALCHHVHVINEVRADACLLVHAYSCSYSR